MQIIQDILVASNFNNWLDNVSGKIPLKIDGIDIERVKKFQYLGSIITPDGGAEEDVRNRIRLATIVFSKLRNLWFSNGISLELKLNIFTSSVKSVLLYGCETWKVTRRLTQLLQVFVNKCLRKICGIFWSKVITNDELLLQKTNQSPIETEIGRD